VVVASSVATGSYTITVTASSTGADGTVDTDTETYNITVTEGAGGSGGSSGNVVNADFDSSNAGFNTLTGINITNGDTTDSGDNEFEVAAASHLANSFIMDGLAGDDTVYFSEAGATYHLDPIDENAFEDVSGFETLSLLSDVDLEINGGVLDSEATGDIEHIQGSGDNIITLVNADADMGLDVAVTNLATIDMNNYDLTLDHSDLSQIDKVMGGPSSTLVFSGQFTYDFAEGLIETEGVTRIGLDAGNYGYVLTLDGIHDEDVREIYAYGANEIEGDVLIDSRENAKITLIDLAGDTYSTGGIDGDSNIFVTYDDELEILGGENDDDVDVILDSDIEDGEFQFDGGGDDEDTLNINLNGDEIDTRDYGRSIDHVEYIDIDAPDGDGEAHLEFLGNGDDQSDIRQVDISDVKDDSSITLDGDLSDQAVVGTPTVVNWGDDQASNFVVNAGGGTEDAFIDGFVADHDVEIMMTNEDDTVSLVIGESDLTFTVAVAGTTLTLAGAEVGAGAANVTGVDINTDASIGQGSQEVTVSLAGGDDIVGLVLGSEQTEHVTLKFSRAGNDDHETIDVNTLEDLGAIAGGTGSATTNARGLRLDFADDVTGIISAGTATAAAMDVAGASQGNVLVFDNAAQRGFVYDHDGDGELSDGDTLVDLTDAASAVAVTGGDIQVTSNGGDIWTFDLSGGDLIDIA